MLPEAERLTQFTFALGSRDLLAIILLELEARLAGIDLAIVMKDGHCVQTHQPVVAKDAHVRNNVFAMVFGLAAEQRAPNNG